MINKKGVFQKYGTGMIIVLWAVACFVFFHGWYHHHFFYQEQNQLFLNSADYLVTYFDKPAWLACLAGDFLTQFYYYLYAGPAILSLVLLTAGTVFWWALRKAGIKKPAVLLTLTLAVITVEAIFCLHYGYRLSSLLALVGGAAVFFIYRRVQNAIVDAVWVVLLAALAYWLFGYGVWAFLLLVLISDVLSAAKIAGRKVLTVSILRLVVVMAIFAMVAATKRMYYLDFEKLAVYPGMGKFVKPEMELEQTFAVENEYYFGNYNKVVAMVEKNGNPNMYELFYYNLVMAQRGMLPDKLLAFPNNVLGTFEKIGPGTPTLTVKMMNELYWVLGDMTFAERAAMLANVFSPDNRNIRMVRRLAEVNMVSGDKAAAMKYLRILQNTFVLNRWATVRIDALSGDGDAASSGVLKLYTDKARYSNHADMLRLNDNTHVIMQELLQSNPDNKVALDYMLCSDLLLKDIETFKRDYDNFYMKQKNKQYEKLYQEAIMIYLAGTQASPKDWEHYVKREDVAQRFREYNAQRGSSRFKDTYWYYFDKGTAPKFNN